MVMIFKKLDAHLRQYCSELTMVPLAYVIRDSYYLPSNITKPYKSDEEKEVACCPHFLMPNHQGATGKDTSNKDHCLDHWFVADNKHVWEIVLYKIFNNMPSSYENMKSASKGKDGCKAYQSLEDHYLGANNTNLFGR
jgi:hypothetical protein